MRVDYLKDLVITTGLYKLFWNMHKAFLETVFFQ
jgi:hypothetical protein